MDEIPFMNMIFNIENKSALGKENEKHTQLIEKSNEIGK